MCMRMPTPNMSAPVTLNGLEVVDDGNTQTSQGVQHGQHHHIGGQLTKQSLRIRTALGVRMKVVLRMAFAGSCPLYVRAPRILPHSPQVTLQCQVLQHGMYSRQ